MPNYLIVQRGPEIGRKYELSNAVTTIGRSSDNDIELNDPYVSRYHAAIKQQDTNYQIIDLGSENPVLVRDTPLEPGEPYTLKHRDIVRVGQNVFSFIDSSAAPAYPSAPAIDAYQSIASMPLSSGFAPAVTGGAAVSAPISASSMQDQPAAVAPVPEVDENATVVGTNFASMLNNYTPPVSTKVEDVSSTAMPTNSSTATTTPPSTASSGSFGSPEVKAEPSVAQPQYSYDNSSYQSPSYQTPSYQSPSTPNSESTIVSNPNLESSPTTDLTSGTSSIPSQSGTSSAPAQTDYSNQQQQQYNPYSQYGQQNPYSQYGQYGQYGQQQQGSQYGQYGQQNNPYSQYGQYNQPQQSQDQPQSNQSNPYSQYGQYGQQQSGQYGQQQQQGSQYGQYGQQNNPYSQYGQYGQYGQNQPANQYGQYGQSSTPASNTNEPSPAPQAEEKPEEKKPEYDLGDAPTTIIRINKNDLK